MKLKRIDLQKLVMSILGVIGLIGAIILMIAYLVLLITLYNGINEIAQPDRVLRIVFSIVTSLIGFAITLTLRFQGVLYAKQHHKEEVDYYNAFMGKKKVREKKILTPRAYWFRQVSLDFLTKAVFFSLSFITIMWFVVTGSKDKVMLGLGIVNLLMMTCFGLMALNSTYLKYVEVFIPQWNEISGFNNKNNEKNGIIEYESKPLDKYISEPLQQDLFTGELTPLPKQEDTNKGDS